MPRCTRRGRRGGWWIGGCGNAGDLRHRRDGAGGVGRFGGEPHGQHGVRGAAQRHGSQPERAEGAEDVLLLEGLVDSSGGNLLQQVQLQLLLAGEDPEGEGRRGSNTGHDGEVDRSCVDASGVDQATSYPTCVGHDRKSVIQLKCCTFPSGWISQYSSTLTNSSGFDSLSGTPLQNRK